MALMSQRISLVERSRSSFCSICFNMMCVGEDVPPSSGDADEGRQWEVQTDEG
jgi:hypothetical protein